MLSQGSWVAAKFSLELILPGIRSISAESFHVRQQPPEMMLSSNLAGRAGQISFRKSGFRAFGVCGGFRAPASPKSQGLHLVVRKPNSNHPQKLESNFTTAAQDSSDIKTGEVGEVAKSTLRKTNLQVVLVSPQIPGNTGCIARSCAAAAVGLHLVQPLGFEISSAKLKRAGLDYWPYVVVKVHKSLVDFFQYFQEQEGEKRLLGFTKKGSIPHTVVKYRPGDWLLFGSETKGLPDAVVEECLDDKYGGGLVRIPIDETYVRCLNLSVAAGIGVYEALRQLGYTQSMIDSPDRDSTSLVREDIFC